MNNEVGDRIVAMLVSQRSMTLREINRTAGIRSLTRAYGELRLLRANGRVQLNSAGRWEATQRAVAEAPEPPAISVLAVLALLALVLMPRTAGAHNAIWICPELERVVVKSSERALAEDCETRAAQLLYEAVMENDCSRVTKDNTRACEGRAVEGSPALKIAKAIDLCRPRGPVRKSKQRQAERRPEGK